MYTHLFFDCDGTLFDFDQSEQLAFGLTAQAFGFDDSLLPLYHQINLQCWKEFEKGSLTMEDLNIERFIRFFQLTNCKADALQASPYFVKRLSCLGIPYPQAKETLQTLKERGYHLNIASNGFSSVQHGRLQTSGLARFFEHFFISEEMHCQKPNTLFFTKMLQETNLRGHEEEALIIGDSLTSDIRGGIDAGLDTVWYNPLSNEEDPNCKATLQISELTELLHILPALPRHQ
ncbi:MAG: YjjG family noncanonical pyrimidine nucleotidase [Sphaerochaetaceae bacterium]